MNLNGDSKTAIPPLLVKEGELTPDQNSELLDLESTIDRVLYESIKTKRDYTTILLPAKLDTKVMGLLEQHYARYDWKITIGDFKSEQREYHFKKDVPKQV